MASRWGLGSMPHCLGTAERCSDSRSAEDPVRFTLEAGHIRMVDGWEKLTPLQQSLPAWQAAPDALRSILMNSLKSLPYA